VSRLLLDTHAFLWFVANDPALSAPARSVIEAADEVLISVASAWEIAIKVRLGERSASTPRVLKRSSRNRCAQIGSHTYRSCLRMFSERLPFHFIIGIRSIACSSPRL
jgi:PIN domain nuclease of toxin-antitoxin system